MNAHVAPLPINGITANAPAVVWSNVVPATVTPPATPHVTVTDIGECRVEMFAEPQAEEWDQFVRTSRNGTIFHQRKFLAYHAVGRFQDASLMIRRKGQLVAVFPAVWRCVTDNGQTETILHSHPGASYGGPVFNAKAKTRYVYDVMSAVCQHAALAGADAVQMRLPPHVFHSRPLEELEFVLRAQGFNLERRELSTYVDIPATGDMLPRYDLNCRNAIHKAQRQGLTTEISRDLACFWNLLADNLARKYGVKPTHTLAELADLQARYPDQVLLFGTYEGRKLLAGTLVFHCNAQAAHTFYMASDASEQPKRPLNLAIHAALCWGQRVGIERMNFGVSTPTGDTVNWGLLAFKESFGGQGTFRDTYKSVSYTPRTAPGSGESP